MPPCYQDLPAQAIGKEAIGKEAGRHSREAGDTVTVRLQERL